MNIELGELPIRLVPRGLSFLCLALGGLSSLGAHAEGLDIPELGVHVASLPPGTALAESLARVDGYLAEIGLGSATLSIARVEEPVPLGSDVQNADYRVAQQRAFHEPVDKKTPGKSTGIDGHPAWTTARVRAGSMGNVNWFCSTYVIVDQHLYRFVVDANGGSTRPPDFDAAMQVMSDVRFIPINRPKPDETSPKPSGLLKMPAQHNKVWEDWYGTSAKLAGEQGVIGMEFSVDSKGHVRDVQQVYGKAPELSQSAEAYIKNTAFDVGPNWVTNGYDKLRFAEEFQFVLIDKHASCPRAGSPRTPGAAVVQICGVRIP